MTVDLEDLWENKGLAGESCACNSLKITIVFLWGLKNYLLQHRAACNQIHVSFTLFRQKTHCSVENVYLRLECSGIRVTSLL